MPVPLATLHPDILEFDAAVVHVTEDGAVELDQTYFYATGGGQPHDTGTLRRNDEEFQVKEVLKKEGMTRHMVDRPGLAEGDKVHCTIDRERRRNLMRMHTATHVLCAVIEGKHGAKVTGNQVGEQRTRVDFDLQDTTPEQLQSYIAEANLILREGHAVRRYVTTREELLKNPEFVKLAMGFPETVTDVHMVEIEGVDAQPCGGTHVDKTSEIGTILFERTESRGKNNRRIYFTLAQPL
jgi:misacylated tRNA(Ala) deacylase